MASFGAVLTLRSGRLRFQDLSSWTRMLTCPCWPRLGLSSSHHGYGELFTAVYTGTRPGLTPAIRAVKGWRGRRELAPRCSATHLAARRHDPGQTRRALNHLNHTHHPRLRQVAPFCAGDFLLYLHVDGLDG